MYVHISKILPIVLQRVLARRDASCWLFTPSTALPSTPYSCSYLPVYLIVKKCIILRSWKMCFSAIANCMHRVLASCWLFTVASLLPPSLRPHQSLLGDPAVCSIGLSTPSFYSSSSSYPLKIRGSLASSNMGLQTVSKPSPVPSQRDSSN